MKIKVKKSWLSDGTIVLEVRDHDAKAPEKQNSWSSVGVTHRVELIHYSHYPRSTPKEEIKTAMKSLKMLHELKQGGV